MKRYLVGGAVRDRLLGRPCGDRDWVVVGARPDELIAAGYTPVGRDFPVFLHPQTHEECALARTERKTAPGYHGFVFHASPEVTLEEDLARRDLTINAMAQDDGGQVIDPYGGQAEYQYKPGKSMNELLGFGAAPNAGTGGKSYTQFIRTSKLANSRNHDQEGQQVAYLDGHAKWSNHPKAGVDEDSIWSIWEESGASSGFTFKVDTATGLPEDAVPLTTTYGTTKSMATWLTDALLIP